MPKSAPSGGLPLSMAKSHVWGQGRHSMVLWRALPAPHSLHRPLSADRMKLLFFPYVAAFSRLLVRGNGISQTVSDQSSLPKGRHWWLRLALLYVVEIANPGKPQTHFVCQSPVVKWLQSFKKATQKMESFCPIQSTPLSHWLFQIELEIHLMRKREN